MRNVFERRTVWMLAAVIAVLLLFSGRTVDVEAARAELIQGSAGMGGLITHFHEVDEARVTRVVVVDPETRRMAVYHVDQETGGIQLKSVRNLTIDLQVQDYNGGDPSPVDMRKLLERK